MDTHSSIFFLCTKALSLGIKETSESPNLLVPRTFPVEIWRSIGNEVSYESLGENCHVNFGSNLLCKITLSRKMFLYIVRLKGGLKKDPGK